MIVTIREIKIPYDSNLLKRWKTRDPEVVPEIYLNLKGPGISNGYFFGEWIAEQFFLNKGYKVMNNDSNLVAKTSKYKENNNVIKSLVGRDLVKEFSEKVNDLYQKGYKIVSHLDLFVYNDNDYFFLK